MRIKMSQAYVFLIFKILFGRRVTNGLLMERSLTVTKSFVTARFLPYDMAKTKSKLQSRLFGGKKSYQLQLCFYSKDKQRRGNNSEGKM